MQVLRRLDPTPGYGLRAVLSAQENPSSAPIPIPLPPTTPEKVKSTCDTFTLTTFTHTDAFTLGHLLYARLLPFSQSPDPKPTLISISSSNGHVLFQAVVGSGTTPDNDIWVARKRATVLRFGTSSYLQHCKFAGNEEAFRRKFGMSEEMAQGFAIHGGAVPIKVEGVEGIVAAVVVSGLKQNEDHGVIVDVIKNHWVST